MAFFELSTGSRIVAGILLLTIIFVEIGGAVMTRIVRGQIPQNEFQKAFARAGHGHAGMFVTLGLIGVILADAADMSGFWGAVARLAIPIGAILLPAGFFASSMGTDVTKPNKAIVLVYLGGLSVAIGAVVLGIALLGYSG